MLDFVKINTDVKFKIVSKIFTWAGVQKYPVKKKDLNSKSFSE